MRKRTEAQKAAGTSDVEPAIVSAAKRQPVDVRKALRKSRHLQNDEQLAVALVDMAYDVDSETVMPFVNALSRIRDETWRARALFSVFEVTSDKLTNDLPAAAQERVVAVLAAIRDERPRAAALRKLSNRFPPPLRRRLAALAEQLTDPVEQLRTVLSYETAMTPERSRSMLQRAIAIETPEARAEALSMLAERLDEMQLREALAAARAIPDPGASGRARVQIVRHIADTPSRQRMQLDILADAEAIADPVRRFEVLAALCDLPTERKRMLEQTLLEMATRFDSPVLRCKALFIAGDFADDEIVRKRAFLSGIAAAETIDDAESRTELLARLRSVALWLHPDVRAELRHAVERTADERLRSELRSALSRLFVHDRALPDEIPAASSVSNPAPVRRVRERRWDVFISYATADIDDARALAFDLRSRGLVVFLSEDNIDAAVGSAGWTHAIDVAIESTRAMLVLVTNAALASKWVAEEWRKYYQTLVENQSGRLISLRLRGPTIAELPLTLRSYQVIDSETGRIEPAHLARILDLLRGV